MLTARTSLLFPRNGHNGDAYFDYFSIQIGAEYQDEFKQEPLPVVHGAPIGRSTPHKGEK